jgi:serine/threonine-protein kinase RIO1
MLTSHPLSNELISRDIQNINNYFRKLKVEVIEKTILEDWIKGGTEKLRYDTGK